MRSRTSASRHARLFAAWLLRVLALVLSTEVSGSLHAAMDVAVVAGVFAHPDDDCERDGHECPPGCLSCHCGHAAAWSWPVVTAVATAVPPPATRAAPLQSTTIDPSGPEGGRLDRPPRSHAHAS